MDYVNSNRLSDYQGIAGGIGGYSGSAASLSGQANAIQPAQQDTLASLIATVSDLAYNLRSTSAVIADSLTGPQPATAEGKSPSPQSALEVLRMITYTLQAALGETSRAKRALGIQ